MPNSIPKSADALTLLHDWQVSVSLLFDAYRALCARGQDTHAEKLAVVERLSLETTLNAQIEQEIFDPALRVAAGEPSIMLSARDSAWALVAHLSTGEPGDAAFDGRLLSLAGDLVRQSAGAHREIARKAQEAQIDLGELGARMAARKFDLLQAYGEPAPEARAEDESADPVGRPSAPP